jgi:outer membrane receptor protein involved in Fe transport
MKTKNTILVMFLALCFCSPALGQGINLAGKVSDRNTSVPLAGVSVTLKGVKTGTVTNESGEFRLSITVSLPVTLVFSSVSHTAEEIFVTGNEQISVQLSPASITTEEVVVLATGVPLNSRRAPVTVERIGQAAIRNAAAPNFYEAIVNLKGVDVTTSSHLFKTVSARGFNGSGSYRVNQFMDGMNNQAPGLNFSLGNFLGMTELDAEGVEWLPGASSALHGSGGLNGTLLLKSKNPFQYPGLSFQIKQGIMHVGSDQRKASPYYDWSIRWAKNFNDRFAFKINSQLIKLKDWQASDTRNLSRSSINSKLKPGDRSSDPNYDGVNVYGDELNVDMLSTTQGIVYMATQKVMEEFRKVYGRDPTPQELDAILSSHPQASPFYLGLKNNLIPGQRVSRTGYDERDMVDYDAYSLKLSGGLYYKINNQVEASLIGYFGKGTTVYTGTDRYSLKGVNMAQYKAELKSKNWFLRAYTTQEDAGEAYNTTALASFINESWKPSADWFPQYIGNFSGARLMGMSEEQAHQFARSNADQGRYLPGTSEFQSSFDAIRKRPIKNQGALFLDKSDLWHYEGQINLSDKIKFAELLVGANYKQYVLNSEGTLFADTAGSIKIPEYGGFAQLQKAFFRDLLKLTVSGRYDKQKNFKGRITPRFTALVRIAPENHIRVSYQTGYRFPANEDQYIDLKTGVNTLIGALPSFWEKYDFYANPVYTATSIATYRETRKPSDLELGTFNNLEPETARSFELGYKGQVSKRLLVDIYSYFSTYDNLLGRYAVGQPISPATRDLDLLSSFTTTSYSYRQNLSQEVNAYGFGIGLEYKTLHDYVININASSDKISDLPEGFVSFFNAPALRFNIGIGNNGLWKGLGFQVNYRWQDKVYWESTFGTGDIPSYGTLDAQISYKIPKIKSLVKLGASNLLNKYYSSAFGNPQIGGLYYVSFGFNVFK